MKKGEKLEKENAARKKTGGAVTYIQQLLVRKVKIRLGDSSNTFKAARFYGSAQTMDTN